MRSLIVIPAFVAVLGFGLQEISNQNSSHLGIGEVKSVFQHQQPFAQPRSCPLDPANKFDPMRTKVLENSSITRDSGLNTIGQTPVSDNAAYNMVLRLLSSHGNNPSRSKRLRSYIRQILGITDERDIQSLLRLAANFDRRTRPNDLEIMAIKARYHAQGHPPYSQIDMQRMAFLRQETVRVVDDIITEIPTALSADARSKLDQRIRLHVKTRIRIR